MIVLVIQVDDLDLGLFDMEGNAPVPGDEQAPCAFPIPSDAQILSNNYWRGKIEVH